MKVVHVYKGFFPPVVGGIERHLATLCGEIGDRVDLSVLTSSASARTSTSGSNGTSVVRLARAGSVMGVPFTPSLPVWLRRLRADIVHLHFPSPMGELGWFAAGSPGRLVVTYHGDIVRQARARKLYGPVARRLLDSASAVVAASPAMITSSEMLRRYADKCELIPYGIDLAGFRLTPDEVPEVERIRRDVAADRPFLLFVGRFVYYKSLPVLIAAMRSVDARLVLVGGGPLEPELRRLVTELGLSDRVTFAGSVADRELVRYLHACDVFVFPSSNRGEAFGIAQVEAMACAKPVVSTSIDTGVSYVNRHEVTGLAVPPGDAEALAAALDDLLADEVKRAAFGRNARELVERSFSAPVMAERTLALYERVLGAAS